MSRFVLLWDTSSFCRPAVCSIMLDVMYDVPSHPEIEEVVISQEVVEHKEKPIVVYAGASRTG